MAYHVGHGESPVEAVRQPEKVRLLLEYEAKKLSLVDVSQVSVVYTLLTGFWGPVVPACVLWGGELLTHSGFCGTCGSLMCPLQEYLITLCSKCLKLVSFVSSNSSSQSSCVL